MSSSKSIQLKVETNAFNTALNRLQKTAGNNGIMPITCVVMLQVEYVHNIPYLVCSATDTIHTIYEYVEMLDCDGIDNNSYIATVDINQFCKLIKSTSKHAITFIVNEDDKNVLHIHGNGKYKLSILYDSSGSKIATINNVREYGLDKFQYGVTVDHNDMSIVNKILGISVAKEGFIIPCYHHYYFGNNAIVASDTTSASCYKKQIFNENTEMLLYNKTVALLAQFNNDFNVHTINTPKFDKIIFKNKDTELVVFINANTTTLQDDYQYNDILDLFISTNNDIIIDKKEIIAILNRYVLFNYVDIVIDVYDNKIVFKDSNKNSIDKNDFEFIEEFIYNDTITDSTYIMSLTTDVLNLKKYINATTSIVQDASNANKVKLNFNDTTILISTIEQDVQHVIACKPLVLNF